MTETILRHMRVRLRNEDPSDGLGDVQESVTRTLLQNRSKFPPAWFGSDVPPPDEVAAFRGLVWKITRYRTLDRVRKSYSASVKKRSWSEQEVASADPVQAIDARLVLRSIASLIGELEPDERELLMLSADSEGEYPKDGKTRVKLHRLRRKIAARLAGELRLVVKPKG